MEKQSPPAEEKIDARVSDYDDDVEIVDETPRMVRGRVLACLQEHGEQLLKRCVLGSFSKKLLHLLEILCV